MSVKNQILFKLLKINSANKCERAILRNFMRIESILVHFHQKRVHFAKKSSILTKYLNSDPIRS